MTVPTALDSFCMERLERVASDFVVARAAQVIAYGHARWVIDPEHRNVYGLLQFGDDRALVVLYLADTEIKMIRVQIRHDAAGECHTIVEFVNGSRACSCGSVRGTLPDLHQSDDIEVDFESLHHLTE